MKCNNCGKEFDGKFCPDCGMPIEEQAISKCPNCGAERVSDGKFCVNCGYNFENSIQSPYIDNRNSQNSENNNTGTNKKFDLLKFKKIFAKIYRWLLAGGMLFVGIVALLCLTAPVITENFLGESNPLCTGFEAISGKDSSMPAAVGGASKMLLVVSLLALVYGGLQLYFAIKKPYINMTGKKKFAFWGIDGVFSLILIILGGVMSSQAKSEELMDGKVGSGFAMAIVMGVFGLLFLGARIFYELKVFKWEDTGLSEEQIAKLTEKKERKKLTKKQIMAMVISAVTVAVLVAIIVPSVIWANNIFRIGKVDKINIGDSQEQVIKVLGEPYEKTDYRYEYYSDDYIEIDEQSKKLEEDLFGNFEQLAKFEEQLNNLTYQYICVDFDSDKKVSSVFFDKKKREGNTAEENKKQVKSYEILTEEIIRYKATDIAYKSKFTDGSFYKGIAVKNCISLSSYNETVKWTDIWGNEYNSSVKVNDNPDILYADYCGDNAWYELSPNGDLIVSGYGSIDKQIDNSKYSGNVTVKIGSGITSINIHSSSDSASSLFSQSSRVREVIFEDSSQLSSIGENAFSGCSSLTGVYITDIASWCAIDFGNYTANPLSYAKKLYLNNQLITELTIPSGVKSIRSNAFYNCSGLISIEIPSNVTSIGEYAFSGCSNIAQATIPTVAIGSIPKNKLQTVIINGGTSIGSYAFSGCSSLTGIEIPSSVTSIGDSAFYNCSNLTSIVIPSSVTSIGDSAFYNCSNLTSIVIPSSVTSIGNWAFSNCSSLAIYCEAESQPSGWDSYWNWSNRLVVWNYGGEHGILENGIKWSLTKDGIMTIDGYSGTSTEVEIPSTINGHSVTSIGSSAFSGCSSLTGIELPSSVTSIGSYAFSGCSSLTGIEIPSSVTSIGDHAFEDCSSLTSIEIPSSVASIGSYAFSYCTSLTSIEIPSGVTSIGSYAFEDCSSLTIYCEASSKPSGWDSDWNIEGRPVVWNYVEYGTTDTGIKWGLTKDGIMTIAGYSGEPTEVEIPSTINGYSVTSIGDRAFRGCSNLTSVEIPSSVTSIGRQAFYGCSNLTIYCEAESQPSGWDRHWNWDDRPVVWNYVEYGTTDTGIKWGLTKDGIMTIAGYSGTSTEVEIPSTINGYSVTSIGDRAFSGCGNLTSVEIPSSVTSIGYEAFRGCSSLTSVEIPSSVTSIGSYAFSGCSSLQYNVYDNGLYLGNKDNPYLVLVRANSKNITSCEINANTKFIYSSAFHVYGGSNLTSIVIPSSVTSIGERAFGECRSLTSIVIPSSVTSIGDYAFEYCSLTIYCEASSKPSGWDSNWNYSNRPVVWGHKISG